MPGDLRPDTGKGEQAGRHLAHQLGKLMINFGDLFGQLLVPAGESAERGLGGMLGVAELLTGAKPGTWMPIQSVLAAAARRVLDDGHDAHDGGLMGSEDDNLKLPTRERAGALASAQAEARRLQGEGSAAAELGQRNSVPLAEAQAIIATWPEPPRKVGETLLDHYGPPNEATPTKLFWYRVRPWARMELTADQVLHNFPTPHTDFLTQYVDYPIRADKSSELVEFDGSVIVDRTAGQIGARCDHEAYNTLTINLAVEILEGRRTVEDARRLYGETASAFVLGRDAPYAEGLLFTPPTTNTADPDESIIASGMAHQVKEKIKDAFGAGDTPR